MSSLELTALKTYFDGNALVTTYELHLGTHKLGKAKGVTRISESTGWKDITFQSVHHSENCFQIEISSSDFKEFTRLEYKTWENIYELAVVIDACYTQSAPFPEEYLSVDGVIKSSIDPSHIKSNVLIQEIYNNTVH